MHVTVLSASDVPNDPRVLRQIDLLREKKHEVRAVGFGTHDLEGILRNFHMPPPGWRRRLRTVVQLIAARVTSAHAVYWANAMHRNMLKAVLESRPDIVHVNDWQSLPIAVAAAKRIGCRVLYDSHEFAVGEREDSVAWRLLFRPYVGVIERSHIRQVDAVVTVSQGIAARLEEIYRLPKRPTVIRNVPRYVEQPFRRVHGELCVLYHGAFMPDRNLESLILSVRYWTPDRRLILRGSGPADYVSKLREIASQAGLDSGRVEFLPAVATSELIKTANAADIGIHPIIPRSVQTNYCLPNKLFEYIMAGLCVVASPAQEMAALVRYHDLGIVLPDTSAGTIAYTINALTPHMVENYKRNALTAAQQLNWENEQHLLQGLYERLAA